MMVNSLRDPAEDFWANLRQQRRPFCRTQGVATLVLDLLATLWLSGLVRAQGKGSYKAVFAGAPSSEV